MRCSTCQADLKPGAKFCIGCGATHAAANSARHADSHESGVCGSCGGDVSPGRKFCSHCGALQTAGSAQAADPGTKPDRLQEPDLQPASMPQKRPRTAMLLLAAAFAMVSTGGVLEYWLAGRTTWKMAEPVTSAVASEIVSQVTVQKIRMAIARDPALQREHVRVTATEHAIELNGTCSSAAARELVRRYVDQARQADQANSGKPVVIDNMQLTRNSRP